MSVQKSSQKDGGVVFGFSVTDTPEKWNIIFEHLASIEEFWLVEGPTPNEAGFRFLVFAIDDCNHPSDQTHSLETPMVNIIIVLSYPASWPFFSTTLPQSYNLESTSELPRLNASHRKDNDEIQNEAEDSLSGHG